ncbi:MAG: septum formation family protein [Gemmatimonadota bacterium]|nr:MAG: septum formation family protein [Gemmatimonadota bacterium]
MSSSAAEHQIIVCWNCKTEVTVPHRNLNAATCTSCGAGISPKGRMVPVDAFIEEQRRLRARSSAGAITTDEEELLTQRLVSYEDEFDQSNLDQEFATAFQQEKERLVKAYRQRHGNDLDDLPDAGHRPEVSAHPRKTSGDDRKPAGAKSGESARVPDRVTRDDYRPFLGWVNKNWPVAITVILLIIVATLFPSEDQPSADGLLEVGDCTDQPAEGLEYFQVNEVPCDQEHVLEVFALVDAQPADNAPFPGHEEAFSAYYQLCDAEFPEYLGTVSLSSEFSIYAVYPSKAGWDDGFTQGICLLGRFDAAGGFLPSVGSARASGS